MVAVNIQIPPKGSRGLYDFDDVDQIFVSRKEKMVYQKPITKAQFSIKLIYLGNLKKQDVI